MKLFAALSAFSASVEACGGTITEHQTISSPVWYNDYYPNNVDCVWTIDLGDVPGFNIVNNFFDLEHHSSCAYDYLKVVENGNEQNFCGETYNSCEYLNCEGYSSSSSSSGSSSSSSSSSYSSSSSSSSYSSGRKRRSEPEKEEDGKYSPDLVNVSDYGFPDSMFISGGSARIEFHTDYSIRHQGFRFTIEKQTRFQIIQHHVGRVVDSVADERWGDRYARRMTKAMNKLAGADTGVSCYDENIPSEAADEGDEVTVFDADNMCKLNGQVNAAINSYARNNACQGRGKVYRQIIRSARKVKKFFNENNEC
uniref:Oikosin 4A protein n=1 Tax=Oikopleura dioica TaxID=34765 RepID=Q95PQ4_OIKDI|nr:Oikosin 4A protein [Oikopleura dioica]